VNEAQGPILVVDNLVAGYEPGLPIVNGASLSAAAGEIVAILGPNGAGKSTLIKAVAGLVPIASGSVSLAGQNIARAPAHQIARRGLAFAPQTENVFASMTVDDNLRLASGILAAAVRRSCTEAMYDFFPDLARQRHLIAGRLSGGQRQMLAIARALLVGPKALMLDEPSAGLSPKLVDGVFAKLLDIRAAGVAIVLVEQNARAALAIADRAYLMADGRNVSDGHAATLAREPVIAGLYLGGLQAAAGRRAAP
jgi:branched-chain amino acid transport system ATP-binding protein